jgi:signal transduction histidine kinase
MLCHGCRDPVAVISLPQGSLLEVNRAFRSLLALPETIPVDLTILSLGGSALGRLLRSWDTVEPRLLRKVTLRGIEGRARLLPIPATFPVQAFFHFMPASSARTLEERTLEELLDERLRQIRNLEHLRSLGETAAIIVHEIKTPLTSIRLALDQMKKSPLLHAALLPKLDMAVEQVVRLDRLLGSIRTFARPGELSLRPVDIRRTLSLALSTVEASIRGPRTSVTIEVRPDPMSIHADPDRLAEAFQNLVTNAVEAMPEGGAISLSAVLSKKRYGWVEIRVGDQGPGIPLEHRHRLFQPFFTTKKTGTGLGLAIVKKIVDLHGGFISVESDSGKGTTVLMELPSGGMRS